MLNNGTILSDRYEILEQVGAGGMATVYKAKDYKLRRLVALKVLKDEYAADENVLEKFRNEALAAAGLTHNNIVGVYDFGQDGELNYIVMEFVDGLTLREYIRKRGGLSSDEILKITIKIAEALRVAHSKGIIHRDIKPQNIMVTPEGAVKVTDFGIAKAVSSATITNQNEAVGSVHYISPEQARGLRVDARSDLYSLGITMYEMATNRVPFEGDTPVAVAMKHLHEPMPEPSKRNANLKLGLQDIILCLTKKSSDDRYQNVDALMADLKKLYMDASYRVKDMAVTGGQSKDGQGKVKMTPEEKAKKKRNLILIAIGIVVAAILLIVMLFHGLVDKAQEGLIPSVVGLPLEQAKEKVEGKGYVLIQGEPQYNDAVPEGYIITQTPDENMEAELGTEVQVVVSLGKRQTASAFNMIGYEYNEIIQILNVAGLPYEIQLIEDNANGTEMGVVFDQKPAEGEPLIDSESGEYVTITLYVSTGSGEKTAIVPSLADMDEKEAIETLGNVGLKIGSVTTEFHPNIKEGEVIAQSISGDTIVEVGTKVDITVSAGVAEVSTEYKTGGTITIFNPIDATEEGRLMIIAYDENNQQHTLYNAEITYFTFSENGETLTKEYPAGTQYIRVTLDNIELLYVSVNK